MLHHSLEPPRTHSVVRSVSLPRASTLPVNLLSEPVLKVSFMWVKWVDLLINNSPRTTCPNVRFYEGGQKQLCHITLARPDAQFGQLGETLEGLHCASELVHHEIPKCRVRARWAFVVATRSKLGVLMSLKPRTHSVVRSVSLPRASTLPVNLLSETRLSVVCA